MLTFVLTALVILAVFVPVMGLATRGRRRVDELAKGEARGRLGPGVETVRALSSTHVDEAVRPLFDESAHLQDSLQALLELSAAYDKVIPILEVMDGARSSPRVYPSNWIGDLMDRFDGQLELTQERGTQWLEAWGQSSLPVRTDLLEGAAGTEISRVIEGLQGAALQPDKQRSSAFAYVGARDLKVMRRVCEGMREALRKGQEAIAVLQPSPYR